MTKTLTIYRIIGPAAWASYFINGDPSGLLPGEKEQADAWIKREGITSFLSCGDEAHFTWNMEIHAPEMGCQGGDVIEYDVLMD